MYSQLTLLKASERSIFRNKDESFLVLIAWRAYWAVPMGLCIWQPSRIPSSSIDKWFERISFMQLVMTLAISF